MEGHHNVSFSPPSAHRKRTWNALNIPPSSSNNLDHVSAVASSSSAKQRDAVKSSTPSTCPVGNSFMDLAYDSPLIACAIMENPLRMFAGAENTTIAVWLLNEYTLECKLKGHARSVIALCVSGQYLLSSGADRTIRIWDCSSDNDGPRSEPYPCVSVLSGYNGHVLSMKMTELNNSLYLGSQNTNVHYSQVNDLTALACAPIDGWDTIAGHHGYVYALETTVNPDMLYTCSSDGSVKAWKLPSMELSGTMKGHRGSVFTLAVAGNLFSGSHDRTIRCWDIETYRCKGVLKGHTDAVLSICSRPESHILCSSGSDSTILVWDSQTCQLLKRLVGHESSVTSLQSCGLFLYSASSDGTMRVWDIDSPRYSPQVSPMSDSGSSVHALLAPDHDFTMSEGSGTPTHALVNSLTSPKDGSMSSLIHSLRKFVSIPSVSGSFEHRDDCWMAAKFLKQQLNTIGAECRLAHAGPDVNPVVLGRLRLNANNPTILICGHYDVQPVDCHSEWETDPFTLTGRNGYLYGRGATDDKGPILTTLFAIRELLLREDYSKGSQSDNTGSSLPNFVFMFQGEGENGSVGFSQVVQDNRELFSGIELVFISNNYWLDDRTPCLTYGMRGHIELKIEIQGPSINLHSGLDGGVIREPLHDLVCLLNKVVDPANGKCLAPDFYKNIRGTSQDELASLQSIDFDITSYKQQMGVSKLLFENYTQNSNNRTTNVENDTSRSPDYGSQKATAMHEAIRNRWVNPAISITGVKCSSDNASIIPHHASGRISIRTVPDQDPKELESALVEYLHSQFDTLQSTNNLSVSVTSNVSWWLGDLNNKYFRCAAELLEKHWKIKPNFVREGGTSQITRYLSETLEAPCLHFPMGQSSDRAHLENERIRLRNLIVGKEVLADFFASVTKEST